MANISITPGTGAVTNTGSDTTLPVSAKGKKSPGAASSSSSSTSSSSSSSGSITSAVSSGAGVSLLDHFTNGELGMKSLVAGNGIHLTEHTHDIQIDVVAQSGVQLNFDQLMDVPQSYAGQAGKVIKVNTTENGLIFDVGAGISQFTGLTDVPQSYTGHGGLFLRVNQAEGGLEFAAGGSGGGASAFVQLSDVPSSYSNQAGKVLAVNSSATGIEFITAPSGGGGSSGAYEFQLTFDSASPNNPTSSSNVPAGWSVALNGNQVTITHNVGHPPKHVTYWGKADLGNGPVWRMRMPSAANEATYPDGAHINDTFYITVNGAVCAADAGSVAKIEVFF